MRVVVCSLVAGLALSACRGRTSCLELDPGREPQRTVAECSADYERTGSARSAIAVVDAHTFKKDDQAVVAWARRVGVKPGMAKIWRRASQVHARRGEVEQTVAAAGHAIELWEQAGELGEAAYDADLLRAMYLAQSRLQPALETARRERLLALGSTDAVMQWGSFQGLFSIVDEVGDYAGAKALLRDMQRRTPSSDVRALRSLRFCEGLMHFREGHLELARLAYRDALELAAEDASSASVRGDYYNLVEIEVLRGDLEAAARALARAVATLDGAEPSTARSARAFFTGLLTLARREYAGTEASVRMALAERPVPFWRWQLEELLGKALEGQGRADVALAAYRRAIAIVEEMREGLAVDVLQVALRDRKRAPYEGAFALEAARGRPREAMQLAQLMWRRGFVESFVEPDPGTLAAPAGVAAGRGAPTDALPVEIDAAVERLRGLTALVPQLQAAARGGSPADEAASTLDVLAFIEARGALWRYRRGAGGASLERLSLSAAAAGRLVTALRAHPEDAAVAAQLGAALLPASLRAQPTRPLAIVADGALAGLPFAALRWNDRWLVEQRALQFWPALAAVGSVVNSVPATPAVVLAAPSGGGPALAAARSEAAAVAAHLGVVPQVGGQATRAALRGAATASLLHVAAHGGLGPSGAYLRLSDGDVTSTDIMTWKVAPRLVVLASCASGARPGGSMWGALGGAFLATGSQSVVATLWSVEDEATAALVLSFYAAGGVSDPSLALATAQRQAIAAGVPPQQWSAFVVLSAPR